MRYLLSVSPAEAAERVRFALRGGLDDSFSYAWKTSPPQGFYGTVEADGFEIGYHDGLISPHRRNLIRPRLLGRLEKTEGGCELRVSFWLNPLLILWYAVFLLAMVMILLHPAADPAVRVFSYLWTGMVTLLLTGFTAFVVQARRRHFRELERMFTGVILEKQKD